jgi:hypothetical protein
MKYCASTDVEISVSDPDPGPLLFVWLRILPLTNKKIEKTLISTVLRLFNDLLSLKTVEHTYNK